MDKYEVGVNLLFDDADYCMCLDKQYTVITEAKDVYEAQEKAIKYVKDTFSLDDNWGYLTIAYVRRAKESDECNC